VSSCPDRPDTLSGDLFNRAALRRPYSPPPLLRGRHPRKEDPRYPRPGKPLDQRAIGRPEVRAAAPDLREKIPLGREAFPGREAAARSSRPPNFITRFIVAARKRALLLPARPNRARRKTSSSSIAGRSLRPRRSAASTIRRGSSPAASASREGVRSADGASRPARFPWSSTKSEIDRDLAPARQTPPRGRWRGGRGAG
jgi:hypothetical protein